MRCSTQVVVYLYGWCEDDAIHDADDDGDANDDNDGCSSRRLDDGGADVYALLNESRCSFAISEFPPYDAAVCFLVTAPQGLDCFLKPQGGGNDDDIVTPTPRTISPQFTTKTVSLGIYCTFRDVGSSYIAWLNTLRSATSATVWVNTLRATTKATLWLTTPRSTTSATLWLNTIRSATNATL